MTTSGFYIALDGCLRFHGQPCNCVRLAMPEAWGQWIERYPGPPQRVIAAWEID